MKLLSLAGQNFKKKHIYYGHEYFLRHTLREYSNNFKDDENSKLSDTIKSLTNQGIPEKLIASPEVKKPVLVRIKEGIQHYWDGSKLLAYETKISTKLLYKLLKGDSLIRREKRQLLRTTSDLIRLVPLVIIAVIPFLEFALPILLKVFPNMLPSTFEDKTAADEKIRKQIKIKLETAKFLQDALEEMSASGIISTEAKKFSELYKKARITGESLSLDELESVCHSLKDSLTIDNLDRAQLVSLCKYMGIKAFGTDSFLRYQIRTNLKRIYADDEEIFREGVNSLYVNELEHACRIRGLFYPGINEKLMRQEMNSWLDLHLKKGIPTVILILARALSPNMKLHRPEEALKETILSLPDAVVNEAELHQQEISGSEAISFKQKLEVLEQQQTLIEAELAQAAHLKKEKSSLEDESSISKEDLKALSEALMVMSSENPVLKEEMDLKNLKEDVEDFKSDVEELEILSKNKLKEPKAAEIIGDKIEEIIDKLESELQSLHDRLGDRINIISADDKGRISVDQLNSIFKMIQSSESESSRLEKIIEKFDADKDGKVFVSDILEMANKAEDIEGQGTVVENCPERK